MQPIRHRPFSRLLDIRRLFGAHQAIDDELAFHIAEATDRLVEEGWSPVEARREAERRFGDLGSVERACQAVERGRVRDEGWRAVFDELRQNLRFGARQLRRSPGASFAAVLSLVAGIGAATAIWSLARATVLEPLPFTDLDRLVRLSSTHADVDDMQASIPDFLDWREQATSFDGLAAASFLALALTDQAPPLRLNIAPVSADFFGILGAQPALGRTFTEDEDHHTGPKNVAVLSHRLFQGRFGGDDDLLGQVIDLDGQALTVIGVMPPSFAMPEWADLWIPLAPDPTAERDDHFLEVIGRLAAGTRLSQAQAEIDRIAAGIATAHPDSNEGWGVRLARLDDWLVGPTYRMAVNVLLAAVGLLVVLAAVNVANLLVARGLARSRELSLRGALGASRGRLLRQLLTEGALLAVVGGLGGVGLAHGLVFGLRRLQPEWIPRLDEVAVDGPVLLFALLLTLSVGLIFALVPAIHTIGHSRPRFLSGGRGTTGEGQRLRSALVAIEVGMAMLLLIGGGLLLDTFVRLNRVDTGFDSEEVLAVRLQLPTHRYTWAERGEMGVRLAEAVAAVPGIDKVGYSNAAPFGGFRPTNTLRVVGQESDEALMSDWRAISTDYFGVLGIPILRGRSFDPTDTGESMPVTIISRAMAEALWPDGDAIGGQIDWGSPGGRPLTVVGVVGDVRDVDLTTDRWTLYRPHLQLSWAAFDLLVRTPRSPGAVAEEIRNAIWRLDPHLPVTDVAPLETRLGAAAERPRTTMTLVVAFATVALVLAASGLYGITLFAVQRRRRELGIRLALGASPRQLVARTVRSGLGLALAGAAVGILSALGGSRLLAAVLYGTRTAEPLVYLIATASLVAVAFVAAYLPARRIARLDPARTLRAD